MKFRRLLTKKTLITVLGIAACIASGGLLPPESAALTMKVIAAITTAFNIGQGIADGWSGGATSSHPSVDADKDSTD